MARTVGKLRITEAYFTTFLALGFCVAVLMAIA